MKTKLAASKCTSKYLSLHYPLTSPVLQLFLGYFIYAAMHKRWCDTVHVWQIVQLVPEQDRALDFEKQEDKFLHGITKIVDVVLTNKQDALQLLQTKLAYLWFKIMV